MLDAENRNDGGSPAIEGLPIPLRAWQRMAAAISGAGLIAVGTWAQIVTGKDGVGTVAFVATGALALLLGIVGRMPTRLSSKDYSMEFVQAVEAGVKQEVAQLVDELPQSVREELGASEENDGAGTGIFEIPTLAQEAASTSIQFERSIKDVVSRTIGGQWQGRDAAEFSSMLDLLLVRDGLLLGVLIKSFNAGASRQVLNRIGDYRRSHRSMPILLITPNDLTLFCDRPPFSYKYFGHRHMFMEGLEEALRRANDCPRQQGSGPSDEPLPKVQMA